MKCLLKMKKFKISKLKFLILILSVLIILILFYLLYIYIVGISSYLKLQLIGDKTVVLNYNDEYVDSGAKAFYRNKNISNNIEVSNNLDLKKIGDYEYIYKIKYKHQTKEVKRKIKVIDKINPNISLIGSNEEYLYVGDNYIEKGTTAFDDYDGDLTSNIKIEGEVDTSKVGEYLITYSIYDSSNNQNSISRKIIVKEKEFNYIGSRQQDGIIGYSTKNYLIEKRNDLYYVNGILIANKSYSLPQDYNPGDLLQGFYDNFYNMQTDASNSGISLRIISGFRSYNSQKIIYNGYVNRDGASLADTYSARAGYSEHQTGLAADINSLDQSFENTEEGIWLNNNCYKYGFIIRYPKGKEEFTGYMFEPWHIRYVGVDIASQLYNDGNWISLEEYLGITSKY